ncbi:hypothetical protein ANANG_G00152880 [Anguilla anguilla]|uniref:Glypican-3 n=1 Tax=Anguilla anguilla TaxID=7936 RepID=A0A9D3M8J8_ANGAN|nr:hypothetical protein ANANG_G00152880 [Anguilla anguilla]
MAGALLLCALFLPFPQTSGQDSCHEVRSSFQLLHPGVKWAPESPVSGVDLQVCQPKGLTCCSRKMEERYQVVARQNMESSLQASSARLKLLIIQNAALFQEAFEMVLRHGRNATLQMLRDDFSPLRGGANGAVGQLFLDVSLYILGSDSRVDNIVASFFDRLFPLAYRRLLGGGGGGGSAALNLGIEVVNTTDHLRPGRDCGRALLRLWHCPRCLGLLAARPCRGFCLSVMRGASGASEDVEAVVMRLHALVRLALHHALTTRNRLKAVVSNTCSYSPPKRISRSATVRLNLAPPAAEPRPALQPVPFDPEETLAGRRREFIASLKGFSTFYSGLGEALCNQESAVLNDSLCWNGQEVTDRFLGTGPKRNQPHGPESKHKAPEPVISQIIDKLKHINQLLRMVTAPERRWRARPGGRAVERGGARRGGPGERGLRTTRTSAAASRAWAPAAPQTPAHIRRSESAACAASARAGQAGGGVTVSWSSAALPFGGNPPGEGPIGPALKDCATWFNLAL